MPYYKDDLLGNIIYVVIKNIDYVNHITRLGKYFVKTVDIRHEYPSTSGISRETLDRGAALLHVPNSMLTFLKLIDVNVLMILNTDTVGQNKTCQIGTSFSIS